MSKKSSNFVTSHFLLLGGSLACLKITLSFKNQTSQDFSGCLNIENDEMNEIKFSSASLRVKFYVLLYEATNYEKNVFAEILYFQTSKWLDFITLDQIWK